MYAFVLYFEIFLGNKVLYYVYRIIIIIIPEPLINIIFPSDIQKIFYARRFPYWTFYCTTMNKFKKVVHIYHYLRQHGRVSAPSYGTRKYLYSSNCICFVDVLQKCQKKLQWYYEIDFFVLQLPYKLNHIYHDYIHSRLLKHKLENI